MLAVGTAYTVRERTVGLLQKNITPALSVLDLSGVRQIDHRGRVRREGNVEPGA